MPNNAPVAETVPTTIWDLPLRIFHWLLALAVVFSLVTGLIGGEWIEWHARSGLFILGLLVFRLIWGVIGSMHARFHYFFPTPARLRAYFNGNWARAGHTPLGALSVFAMLGLLIAQVATGLGANDAIAFEGPLYPLLSSDSSDRLSALHTSLYPYLIALLVLHVLAIAYYTLIKRKPLVKAMFNGKGMGQAHEAKATNFATDMDRANARKQRGGWLAFSIALLIAAIVVWSIASGYLVQRLAPATAPTAQTPTAPAW